MKKKIDEDELDRYREMYIVYFDLCRRKGKIIHTNIYTYVCVCAYLACMCIVLSSGNINKKQRRVRNYLGYGHSSNAG